MATPGTFVAVLGGGEWHEVFLLQSTSPGGCDWICSTTDGENQMTHFYSAVRLVQGAVVFASDIGSQRSYPGLQENQVNWMVDETFNAWVPTQEDKTEFERTILAMSKWAPIPEQCYFCAGGPTQQFADLAMVAAARQNDDALQAGCFAIIKRGAFWHEIFVCLNTSNNTGWLCCTSSYTQAKVWTAIQFMPGSYLIAEGLGSERMYPGVSFERVNWICTGEGAELWNPTSAEAMGLLEEAKTVSAQLGTIPQEIYCVSGGSQDCVHSIEDMLHILQNRVPPTPGKFVLIQLASVWQEALLCAAAGDTHWLCLCSTRSGEGQTTSYYWTLQTLVEGKYFVLPGAGADRHATAYPVQNSCYFCHTMCKVPENSLWLPTPQRIRKALSDASEVLSQLQSGKLVLPETEDENRLQAVKAGDLQ